MPARPEGEQEAKGPIVLATVKGDIHDIGKNIVKVLLENYGYTVIDLGKDVDPEAVVTAARERGAPLVGLSALMTTTLPSMEETIARLRPPACPARWWWGARCSPPSTPKRSGPTSNARDAKQSVDVARQVIG